MANPSKKDIARVLAGEKKRRAWLEYVKTPAKNPLDKDGNVKQVRARFPRKEPEYVPEEVDKAKAIQSGGITPGVTLRSADSKFARHHREFSGQVTQGKVQVSLIDGHVYGSVQKIGRSLEEYAHDEGMGQYGALIGGKGKDYVPQPFARKRKDSPFKVAGKRRETVIIKKG